jgi:quercetin dioxygenase-like cupin family protein
MSAETARVTFDEVPNSAESVLSRVETITHNGKALCMLIHSEPCPSTTTFYTPKEFNLQVGKVVYSAGGEIPRHIHHRVNRIVEGTSEVLVVQKGRMVVDLYTDEKKLLCSREMGPNDVIILMGGGHGFRLLEDTVLIEVKQGPYSGVQEKERF